MTTERLVASLQQLSAELSWHRMLPSLPQLFPLLLMMWSELEELEVERSSCRDFLLVTVTVMLLAVDASVRSDLSHLPTAPEVTYID